jgi:AcrR family transcriptional regulator
MGTVTDEPAPGDATGPAADDQWPGEGSPRTRRRQILIQAAGELFDERPFDAVTVEMICARAGVSGPALYRHFGSKQALLVAVLEDPLNDLLRFAREAASTHADPRDALIAMIDFHTERVLSGSSATWIFAKNEHSAPDEDRRRLRRMMRMYVEEWVNVISTLRPELSDAQARVAAHAVFGLLNSLTTFNSGLDKESIAATVRPMVLNALLTRDAPGQDGPH